MDTGDDDDEDTKQDTDKATKWLLIKLLILYLPRREKTCLRGFRQSEFQTRLLSYRD